MATYEDWLRDFLKGKKHVADFPDRGIDTVHTIKRYADLSTNHLWEIGLTYTSRVVVRSGKIQPDGKTEWTEWETKHEVHAPVRTK